MDAEFWKKKPARTPKPAKRRILDEEEFDRDGHWMRDFHVRGECWPTIEHWAHQHDYHLVAIKGRRRLYQRGADPHFYTTFLDIRHDEGRVVMRAWVQVGFRLRLMSLFLLSSELPIDPNGILGVRTRRTACREMNELLIRLRQPEIAGSQHFHYLDLDLSTITLSLLIPMPIVFFFLAVGLKLELATGLSNSLMFTMGKHWVTLLGVGGTALLLHHFALVKQTEKKVLRWVSSGIWGLTFFVFSVFLFTQASSEIRDQKLVYHCITHFNAEKCSPKLAELTPAEKDNWVRKIDILDKHLANKK